MSELLIDLDPRWREKSTLTGVRLPDGTTSGGVLTDPDAGELLVLFDDRELDHGDRIVVGYGLVLTVTDVQHGTLTGQRVTALEVRRSGYRH